MTIHFITSNQGKLREIQRFIPELEGLNIDLVEIQSSNAQEIIRAKLIEAARHHEGALIVEDTSLYIDSLNGLPGPLIKWFLKSIGNAGIFKIAQAMGDMKAKAQTIIGLREEDGSISFFTGTLE